MASSIRVEQGHPRRGAGQRAVVARRTARARLGTTPTSGSASRSPTVPPLSHPRRICRPPDRSRAARDPGPGDIRRRFLQHRGALLGDFASPKYSPDRLSPMPGRAAPPIRHRPARRWPRPCRAGPPPWSSADQREARPRREGTWSWNESTTSTPRGARAVVLPGQQGTEGLLIPRREPVDRQGRARGCRARAPRSRPRRAAAPARPSRSGRTAPAGCSGGRAAWRFAAM